MDLCYRPEPFTSERQRVEYLFALYEKLTAPLVAAAKCRPRPRRGVVENAAGSGDPANNAAKGQKRKTQ